MSAVIRMSRHGAKKHPIYRIVVADKRSPRDGRLLEQVGIYDPNTTPVKLSFDEPKLARWLSKGARPSQTVSQLMKQNGLEKTGLAKAAAPEATEQTS